MMRIVTILAAIACAAACGFDCEIQNETEHFSDCDALQSRIDDVQNDAQPDNAELDDLVTCGEAFGCEVEP